MNDQALNTYAEHFEAFTDTLGILQDADIFLALFIRRLTEQLHQMIHLDEVHTYEGLCRQAEENLYNIQKEYEAKHAIIQTAFFRIHPDLKGLEWHSPLVPEPQS